jgi:homoserine dehydrogenase
MTLNSNAATHTSILLYGFGTVGEGLYLILNDTPQPIAQISNIVVRTKGKPRSLPQSAFLFAAPSENSSPFAPTVVELIDRSDEALRIVTDALKKGIPCVSANKKMIASHLPDLLLLQDQSKSPFLYEGAVCGSIPIIHLLDTYFAQEPFTALQGIVNGTCNYILSAMQNEQLSYATALEKAQAAGFAESDPTSDVKGWDAAYKLTILTLHAFGNVISPVAILRMGIDLLDDSDLAFAKKRNKKIKLIATAKVVNGALVTYVLPTFVEINSPFYTVDAEYNAIVLEGKNIGQQFYKGKGAGAFPTAAAVVSDIQNARLNKAYKLSKRSDGIPLSQSSDALIKVYIRTRTSALITALPFVSVAEGYIDEHYRYIVGTMRLAQLVEFAPEIENDQGIIIAF